MADTITNDGSQATSGKTVEQLQAEIDALKTKADKSDYFKAEMEKIIGQRDKLKGDLKAKEDAELIAKGDLQKALDAKIKELEEKDRLIQEKDSEITPLKEFKTNKEAEEIKRREALINKLPDEDSKAIAKAISDPIQLEKYIESKKTPNATKPDGGDGITGKDPLTLTDADKEDARIKFPSIEDEKVREKLYLEEVKPKLIELEKKRKKE